MELGPFKSNSVNNASTTSTHRLNTRSEMSTINSVAKSAKDVHSFLENSSRSIEPASKLVLCYVEELKLKYFQTSHFFDVLPPFSFVLE